MTRIGNRSEEKVIIHEDKRNALLPIYLGFLEELIAQYPTEKSAEFSKLVNFTVNKTIPIHDWFDYRQGYSARLVRKVLLNDKPPRDYYILDPFVGVGTTCLVAQALGYQSIGFDINPVACFAAKVKTSNYNREEQARIQKFIEEFKPVRSEIIPESAVVRTSFNHENFEKLMGIKGFYEGIDEPKINSFFKLAYLSIVEDCSLRVKDGNGLKLVKNKKIVRDVQAYFLKKARKMIDDITKHQCYFEPFIFSNLERNYKPEAIIINNSMSEKESFNEIKDLRIGEVIFSPPYANCFDYCEVYKLEIWMGTFVQNYSDFKRYRDGAVRSHVNASFDHSIKHYNQMADIIAELIGCFNIWNKNIPDMIRGYFDDMTKVLMLLKNILIEKAKCYIVVANSAYKGILVPTDLLIARIAETIGFKVNNLIQARKIRTSSQQMKQLQKYHIDLTRESIIILENS